MREVCEETLRKLPDAAWDKQTKESMAVITREIQTKLANDGRSLAVSNVSDASTSLLERIVIPR